MVRRIEYTDFLGRDTEITWYAVDPDTGFYDFCGGATPLNFKWYGERYDNIKPSVVEVEVLVKSEADAAIMEEQLNGGFYIQVRKDKEVFWVGKVWPQYYEEPYKQFPYVIKFSASDQLGQLKRYQFLMIDFPDPHHRYRLIDILNKALSEPTFKPSSTHRTAPDILRVSSRIFKGITEDLFENIYIDPRCFMKMDEDVDEYLSKLDMLNAILKPLHLKLFQWEGKWWVMSIDGQWNAGSLNYVDYHLAYVAGPLKVGTGTLNDGILNPYVLQNTANPEDRQVYDNASMTFLPAWGQYTIRKNFQQNTELLPFANRSGNFYWGNAEITPGTTTVQGINLELEQRLFGPAPTYVPGRRTLSHWAKNPNGTELGENEYEFENSGRITYPTKLSSDDNWVDYEINLPPIKYDFINIDGFIEANQSFYVAQRLVFKLTDGTGKVWWLENANYDHNTFKSGVKNYWRDYFVSYYMNVDKQAVAGFPFSTTVDHPGNPIAGIGTKLEVRIYRPSEIGTSATLDPIFTNFSSFKVYVSNRQWEGTSYKMDTLTEVSASGTEPPFDIDLIWGIEHPGYVDSWFYHLSSPYTGPDKTDTPINVFQKEGEPGTLPPNYKPLTDWLILSNFNDNETYTPQLTGSYRSKNVSPVRLIYDYEGRIYDFTSGTLNDKRGIWTNVYTQFKAIRNVGGADFDPADFSDDFFITN